MRSDRTVNRLSALLDIVEPLPVCDGLQKVFGVSRRALLSAVAEALDLGLGMVRKTPTGPVLVEDDCPSSDYAPPAEAIPLCARALGLHREGM